MVSTNAPYIAVLSYPLPAESDLALFGTSALDCCDYHHSQCPLLWAFSMRYHTCTISLFRLSYCSRRVYLFYNALIKSGRYSPFGLFLCCFILLRDCLDDSTELLVTFCFSTDSLHLCPSIVSSILVINRVRKSTKKYSHVNILLLFPRSRLDSLALPKTTYTPEMRYDFVLDSFN